MNMMERSNSTDSANNHIIKAKKLKDGFTFKLSVDHIIEQTLLKQYNSPMFKKSTIQIEDTPLSDAESDDSEATTTKPAAKIKGVPIKLHLKRQFADSDTPSSSDSDTMTMPNYNNINNDEPLDMTTKKVKKESPKPLDITAIPPGWIMKGLSREDHMKFQNAVSRASCSPYQQNMPMISKHTGVHCNAATEHGVAAKLRVLALSSTEAGRPRICPTSGPRGGSSSRHLHARQQGTPLLYTQSTPPLTATSILRQPVPGPWYRENFSQRRVDDTPTRH